jgi:hypothetical protein
VIVFSILALSLAIFVLHRFDPAKVLFYPTCLFHDLTGLNCPGCGTLRALHQLSRGHLKTALHYNPLTIIALPFLGWYFLSELLKSVRGKGLPRVFKSPVWGWIVAGIVIAFWILRNIPVYPFTLLSP